MLAAINVRPFLQSADQYYR